jgi:hypothetical protein
MLHHFAQAKRWCIAARKEKAAKSDYLLAALIEDPSDANFMTNAKKKRRIQLLKIF